MVSALKTSMDWSRVERRVVMILMAVNAEKIQH